MTSGVSAVGCIGLFGGALETMRASRDPRYSKRRTSRHALPKIIRSAARR